MDAKEVTLCHNLLLSSSRLIWFWSSGQLHNRRLFAWFRVDRTSWQP